MGGRNGERLVGIGLDLHDGPLQDIAFLIGNLRALRDRVAEGEPRQALLSAIGELESVLLSLDHDLRELSTSLVSGKGPDPPFGEALSGVVGQFEHRSGITVDLRTAGELDTLRASERRALVQVAREALANVLKHSGAATVRVEAVADDSEARLDVEDDGRGVDLSAPAGSSGGLGIPGMTERMRKLGGSVEVRSTSHGGTRVTALLPRG